MTQSDLEKLKNAQTRFVVGSYSPLSIVDSQHLKELFQFGIEIGARYGCADLEDFWFGRKAVTNNLKAIKDSYDVQFKKLIEQAKKSSSIAICADIWSDNLRHNSYLDVTVILVSDEFDIRHTAIAFEHFDETHTGEHISVKINEALTKFRIQPDAVAYVTDSAANMRNSLNTCEWYPCFAHKLNTCIEDSFKAILNVDSEINSLWTEMIDIRSFINRSSDFSDKLCKKLPVGCITRPWSGYHNFLNAFIKSYEDINLIAQSKSLKMPTNKPLIEMLYEVFATFEPIFKKFQQINAPSLHLVVLELFRLKSLFEKPSSEGGLPQRMSEFTKIILESLAKKYASSISDAHIMALFLHPNYKKSVVKYKNFLSVQINSNIEAIEKSIVEHHEYLNILQTSLGNLHNF